MDVTYVRYNDDILILCKSKRQMLRAKRRMMQVLAERKLTLSRKKTRMGPIEGSFHFLGFNYHHGTQPCDHTNTPTVDQKPQSINAEQRLNSPPPGGATH